LGTFGRHDEARVADDELRIADIGCDCWEPASHSFGKDVREALAAARTRYREIRGGEQTRHVVAAAESKDVGRSGKFFRAGSDQHCRQITQPPPPPPEPAMI